MTRVAPGSSASIRAAQSLLEARWRVGARGSLALGISQGAHSDSVVAVVVLGSERFVLEGQMAESLREVRFSFAAASGGAQSAARGIGGEPPENSLASRGPRHIDGFTAALCASPSASESDRVLLTDLPTRLGLIGGTYVLESIRSGF